MLVRLPAAASPGCRRCCCCSLQVLFAGSFAFLRKNLFLFPAITVVLAAPGAARRRFTMLALSSLSNSSRFVGILYAGVDLLHGRRSSGRCCGITGSSALSLALVRPRPSSRSATSSSASSRATTRRWPRLVHRDARPDRRCRSRCSSAGCAAWRWSHERAPSRCTPTTSRSGTGRSSASTTSRVSVPAGHHRAARAERRRQVHVHEADDRAAEAEQGHASRCSASRSGATRGCTSASGSARSRTRSTSG